MQIKMLRVVRKQYFSAKDLTAIECVDGNETVTVFAKGNLEANPAQFANIAHHQAGDKFTAASDSKVIDEKTKQPLYKKGDVVTRQKSSYEFKQLTGGGAVSEFAVACAALGITPNMVLSQ